MPEGNGCTSRNIAETKFTQTTKSKETQWMKKLKTIYPYELNDLTSDDFRIVFDTVLTGVNLFHLKKELRQSRWF